jgi:hypothetical protein
VSQTLAAISVSYSELEQVHAALPDCDALKDINNACSTAFNQWSHFYAEQIPYIETYVTKYQDYAEKEVPSLR